MTEDRLKRSYLVYVKSSCGVHPQKWSDLYFGERGDRRQSVVAIFTLGMDEAELSVDELARRHPLPPKPIGEASR